MLFQPVTDLVSTIGSTDTAYETGEARGRNVVFFTWNWGAAFSTDSGRTFTYVDPTSGLGTPGNRIADRGFCCDQVVTYSHRFNLFVWVRQTNPQSPNSRVRPGENRERVSVATPASITSPGGPRWDTFDLTPERYGVGGQRLFLDFPTISASSNYLYLSFLLAKRVGADEPVVGSVVHRIPLQTLRSGGTGGQFFTSRDISRDSSPASIPAFHVVQASDDDQYGYFASRVNSSTIRSYKWKEVRRGVIQAGPDVAVPSSSSTFASQVPGGNGDWLPATSKLSDKILGATRSGDRLWYAWTSGTVGPFKQSHIQIAVLDTRTMRLVEEQHLYNPSVAFAWPALATNKAGEVGIAFAWGGGSEYVHAAAGFLTGTRDLRSFRTSWVGIGSGGHYMTIGADDDTNAFTVGYWVDQLDPDLRLGGKRVPQDHPYFAAFGRSGEKP